MYVLNVLKGHLEIIPDIYIPTEIILELIYDKL